MPLTVHVDIGIDRPIGKCTDRLAGRKTDRLCKILCSGYGIGRWVNK